MKSGAKIEHAARTSWLAVSLWTLIGLIAFHLAQSTRGLGWFALLFPLALLEVSRLSTKRRAFYTALIIGLGAYGPQLGFFWSIFGGGAIALWLVLAFWVALFVLLVHGARQRFGEVLGLCLAPVIWTGLEFFRGELYFLRFTWLTLGMAHSGTAWPAWLGTYGLGFVACAFAVMTSALVHQYGVKTGAVAAAVVISLLTALDAVKVAPSLQPATVAIPVAGVQLEFASEHNVLRSLDQLVAKYPAARLLMLSEYTFDGPPSERVRNWCRQHDRFLVAGGKELLGRTNFYNTAYVIGPDGEIVQHQVKSVPIQFFKDGLPAPTRKVWQSPWGPLGILICYDLSYTRVVDDFIRQGAKALLVPTMDVEDWGSHQHELHARLAPHRAAEYGLPIFRVCSSGISQLVAKDGAVLASAPFPGQGAMLGGSLPMDARPGLPLDRTLAPICTVIAALLAGGLALDSVFRRKSAFAGNPPKYDGAACATASSPPSDGLEENSHI